MKLLKISVSGLPLFGKSCEWNFQNILLAFVKGGRRNHYELAA